MKSKSKLLEIHQKIISLDIRKSFPSLRVWNFFLQVLQFGFEQLPRSSKDAILVR
jgi:hypothetical protein